MANLTRREKRIVDLKRRGKSNAQIAKIMGITKGSVASTVSELRGAGVEIPYSTEYKRSGGPMSDTYLKDLRRECARAEAKWAAAFKMERDESKDPDVSAGANDA